MWKSVIYGSRFVTVTVRGLPRDVDTGGFPIRVGGDGLLVCSVNPFSKRSTYPSYETLNRSRKQLKTYELTSRKTVKCFCLLIRSEKL